MTEGAYLMSVIRSRCVEEGDCLLWTGEVDRTGRQPRFYVDGKRTSVRLSLFRELKGEPKDGYRIGVRCGTARCVEPDHLVARTRSQALKGVKRSLATRAKIARARAPHRKLSDEQVAEIRASDLNQYELAAIHGVSQKSISRVIRNETFQTYGGHFAGLGERS